MFKFNGVVERFYGQFKEPGDVHSAIYPLYYVCSWIGLAPYAVRRVENGKRTFEFGLWPIIKTVILVLFFLALVLYNLIFLRDPFKDSEINVKIRYFQEIFIELMSSCSIVFGCIFALKIIEVFKNVDEIDISFRSLAVWIPYKDIYVRIIIHLLILGFCVIGSFSYVITENLLAYRLTDFHSTLRALIDFVTVIMPYFINLVMEIQYYHYLDILRVRYKVLNEYLEALVQENKPYNGWVEEEITTIGNSFKKSKLINSSTGKSPKNMIGISDPVFIVDQVAALHIKLTDTAHVINYAFCVQQLLRITVAFVSIVIALFWIAINFSKSVVDSRSQLDIFFTLWAFSNACEVMGIVWITSETCEEANTCPRILHKIRNNTTNIKLQDTIEIYSLQMYHNRLSFTVCGLFPLDYTLLYTIVAGVTTYLVILIQFNNTDFVKMNGTSTTETSLMLSTPSF